MSWFWLVMLHDVGFKSFEFLRLVYLAWGKPTPKIALKGSVSCMLLAYHDLLSSLFSILPLLRNISLSQSQSIPPSRIEVLSQPRLKHQRGTEKRIEGFGVFFGCRCQELKNHSSSPLRTGFEKEMDMSFPIPGNFFFFWRLFFEILIYFNFSNPSKLPENRSGEDWRELSINWFLPLEALCVRSWCLERFRRFIALQWSKTPWSQFGKRPGIFGLDWIFWYLS